MQRLFSMFPQGAPGFALLLLRISVAMIFLTSIADQSLVSSVPPGLRWCVANIRILEYWFPDTLSFGRFFRIRGRHPAA